MPIDINAGDKSVRYTAPSTNSIDATVNLDQAAEPMTDAVIEAPASQRALHRAQTYAAKVLSAQEGVVHVLRAHGTTAEIESAQAVHTVATHQLNGVLAYLPAPVQPAGVANSGESDADFWGRISDAIGNIKDDYLGVYETAMTKNNEFQRDFTYILSQLSKWQKGDDKNTILKLEGSIKVARSPEEMAKLVAETKQDREAKNEELLSHGGPAALLLTDDDAIREDLEKQGLDKKDVPDGLLDALKALLEDYKDGPSTVFITVFTIKIVGRLVAMTPGPKWGRETMSPMYRV